MDDADLEEMETAELYNLSDQIKQELRRREGYTCRDCGEFQNNHEIPREDVPFEDYEERYGGLCQSCFKRQVQSRALAHVAEQLIGTRVCGLTFEEPSSTRTEVRLEDSVTAYLSVPTKIVENHSVLFDVTPDEIREQVRSEEIDEVGDSAE